MAFASRLFLLSVLAWLSTPASCSQFVTLRDWLCAQGGFVHKALLLTQDWRGSGLALSEPVGENTILIAVPSRVMLTAEAVLLERPRWSKIAQTLRLDDEVLIGMFLAARRFLEHQPLSFRAHRSFFDVFINSLPATCINSASIPVDVAVAAGVREPLLQRVTMQRRNLERTYALLQRQPKRLLDVNLTLDELAWGVCIKQTRSFSTRRNDTDAPSSAMTPVMDLVNHSHDTKRTARFHWATATDIEQLSSLMSNSASDSRQNQWILKTRPQQQLCIHANRSDCDVVIAYRGDGANW